MKKADVDFQYYDCGNFYWDCYLNYVLVAKIYWASNDIDETSAFFKRLKTFLAKTYFG